MSARSIQTFACRVRQRFQPTGWARRFVLRRLGMHVGLGTFVGRISVVWPHQVHLGHNTKVLDGAILEYCHGVWRPGPAITIGDHCYVGRGADFNCRERITVGNDCLIGAGCRLVDHDHGMDVGQPMRVQAGPEAAITLEDDVWLGANVVVLKGVTIGRGAVVAAGAVVNRSIPAYEIWGGIPAKRLGTRQSVTAVASDNGTV